MNYKYRVTLSGLKGFFRLYGIGGSCSLYTFHKQMRADMEFAPDQQILFKAFSADGSVVARYALIDLGFGTVDHVSIEQCVAAGITSFQYFYDTISKKSVIVTLEAEEEGAPLQPTLLEVKGPNPVEFENGYVAFEDLPDEQKRRHKKECECGEEDCDCDCDDEDDDEEDEDEEKEELIYDSEE